MRNPAARARARDRRISLAMRSVWGVHGSLASCRDERAAIWDRWPLRLGAERASIATIVTPVHKGDSMARIRITTDPLGTLETEVVLDERIIASDLSSDHFAAALIERIGWALADADEAERRRRT